MSEGEDAKYTLTINGEQAKTLMAALELYSRMLMGQVHYLGETGRYGTGHLPKTMPFDKDEDGKPRPVDEKQLEAALRWLNVVVTGSPGHGSWGITSEAVDDRARVAYDMQQVIRHFLAFERKPEGGIQVDFDAPMKWGAEPLATFKRES